MAIYVNDETNTRSTPFKLYLETNNKWNLIDTLPYLNNWTNTNSTVRGFFAKFNGDIHAIFTRYASAGSTTIQSQFHYKWNKIDGWVLISNNLPYGFDNPTLIEYDNALHIIDGHGQLYPTSGSSYNWQTPTTKHYKWTENSGYVALNDIPFNVRYTIGISKPEAFVYEDELHIVNGYGVLNNSTYIRHHYKYNKNNDSWVSCPSWDTTKPCGFVVVHDGVVFEFFSPGTGSSGYMRIYNNTLSSYSQGSLPFSNWGSSDSWAANLHVTSGQIILNSCLKPEIYFSVYGLSRNSGGSYVGRFYKIDFDVDPSAVSGTFYIGRIGSGRYFKLTDVTDELTLESDAPSSLVVYSSNSFVELDNKIHVMGTNSNNSHSLLKGYDFYTIGESSSSADESTYSWKECGPLPYTFNNCSVAVVYNDLIHIVGNDDGNLHYKLLSNNSFEADANLITPIGYAADILGGVESYEYGDVVCDNNSIYALFGDYRYYYSHTNSSWRRSGELPYTFNRGSAVILNGELHILGGDESSGNSRNHYKWSASMGTWVQFGALPYDFEGGIALVLNNEIHILGGINNFEKHWKWNGSVWTSVSTLPYTFSIFSDEMQKCQAATVLNGKIHLFAQNSHYRYNNNGTWTLITNETPFYIDYGGSCVVFNNSIYMFKDSKYYCYGNTPPIPWSLASHLFNKINGVWTKVKVPTYDQYGNCHIEEQAKKVKAIWVGGPDNKAKRVFY